MEFNKEQCIANIYALAKEQGVKIGELESAANISVGYLSRLAKENNNALPNIEALVIISDKLNVSLDALVKKDLTVNNSTESYFIKVVDKLLDDTKIKPSIWVLEHEDNLKPKQEIFIIDEKKMNTRNNFLTLFFIKKHLLKMLLTFFRRYNIILITNYLFHTHYINIRLICQ